MNPIPPRADWASYPQADWDTITYNRNGRPTELRVLRIQSGPFAGATGLSQNGARAFLGWGRKEFDEAMKEIARISGLAPIPCIVPSCGYTKLLTGNIIRALKNLKKGIVPGQLTLA